ncbi:MBL fold metallo-hydrolase [Pyruvatibacter sp.]|uniref:MBL fold metallo-hydrolase n=1 Tax=Pyruvatibacter sp. TaxID=1981328 RepID=UPI003267D815
MKRVLIGIGVMGVVVIAALTWFSMNTKVLMKRQIDANIRAMMEMQEFPATRFEVIFCGTGSPQYNPDRSQPCLGVIAGGMFFLFDAGQGAAQQLNATRSPFQKLETIFLTHLHSDHMSGTADVLHNGWLLGRQELIEVVGPPGTEQLLEGISLSFQHDIEERQRVLGTEYANNETAMGTPREITIDTDAAVTVFDRDGVVIRAFRVEHPDWPHAYGYRVEFAGKSIVISGDTRYTRAIGRHAQGVDLLIHEVVNVEMMEMAADSIRENGGEIAPERLALITAVHTPTLDVARAAVDAQAKKLVLTHLIPPIPANSFVESIYVEGMDDIYEGDIIVARDGMRLTLIE